jgi:hypothetical protein
MTFIVVDFHAVDWMEAGSTPEMVNFYRLRRATFQNTITFSVQYNYGVLSQSDLPPCVLNLCQMLTCLLHQGCKNM